MMNEMDLLGTINKELVSRTPILEASSIEKRPTWFKIGHFSNPGRITGVRREAFSRIDFLIKPKTRIMTCWMAQVLTWSSMTALLMLIF